MAFPNLEHLTHIRENLLVPLRDGELRLTNDIADGLLAMVDAVRGILQTMESTGAEDDTENNELLVQLERLLTPTIIEAIKDPLTHIVRNSVDHGIESSEERQASGKLAGGTLWLRAYHEGGQVNVEISDDGGGINVERVKEKAIANGVAAPEQVAEMNDRELTNLILLPGFSTAAKVRWRSRVQRCSRSVIRQHSFANNH